MRLRLQMEALEERTMLATFTVTNVFDAGSGSLRQAITDSNSQAGPDTIAFSIGGGGVQTIRPTSPLPTIVDAVVIDGTTQPGYSGAPLIEIDGSLAGFANGLRVQANHSTIRGLVINRFAANGILIEGGSGNAVEGSYLGTDVSGTVARGNGQGGVEIHGGATHNRVGTDGDGVNDAAESNLISGNLIVGVDLRDAGTNDNVVAGNMIGLDVTGSTFLGNQERGVDLYFGVQHNRIGTNGDGVSDDLEQNVISGNLFRGVDVVQSSNNWIAGNLIGTNAAGSSGISSIGFAVYLFDSNHNLVGTNGDGLADAAERNVIFSESNAVLVQGAAAHHNVIAGNYLGVDVSGTTALGGALTGVHIVDGASDNLVGTNGDGLADAAERNIVSGQSSAILISGAGTSRNVVAGNFIGTEVSGTSPLPNGQGIAIFSGASHNLIGTDGDGLGDAAERNVIAAGARGVLIQDTGTHSNAVAGNFIGTDMSGTMPLANDVGVVVRRGASGNRIGTDGDGTADGAERNVISGNTFQGIQIQDSGTDGNTVSGNFIGTDATGTLDLGNGDIGVRILLGAQANRIGTDGDGMADAAERNVISGNDRDGIKVRDLGTNYNVVAGNFIGTDVTGLLPLGNARHGVFIGGPGGQSFNRVGTDGNGLADATEANVISANGGIGVALDTVTDPITDNLVAGNLIGTGTDGMTPLGNVGAGVAIGGYSVNNQIGGSPALANVIAYNSSGVGLFQDRTRPYNNRIQANSIHSNLGLGIDLELDGPTPNDPGDADPGSNNRQNSPQLTFTDSGPDTRVVGRLHSTPQTLFTIDVYANASGAEGERYLGAFSVLTDGTGNVDFDEILIGAPSTTGESLTATATDPLGNTSEFSTTPFAYVTDEDTPLSVSAPGVLVTDDVAAITSGMTLNYDAEAAADGTPSVWENTGTFTGAGFDWSFSGDVSLVPVVSSLPGVTQAYRFTGGAAAVGASLTTLPNDPSDGSASWEFWIKPADLGDSDQVIFETGGSGDGMAIWYSKGVDGDGLGTIKFTIDDGSVQQTVADVQANSEFIQVVGVYSKNAFGSTDTMELYINGQLIAADSSNTGLDDWAGGSASGLGTSGGSMAQTVVNGQFRGELAKFRFYERPLSGAEVRANHYAIARRVGSFDTVSVLGGVVAVSPDGSFTYDPAGALDYLAAGETADDSFAFTAVDGNGATYLARTNIQVTGVNDAPTVPMDADVATANEVSENSPTGTTVGVTALSMDVDHNAVIQYSLSDDAGGRFQIDSSTGVVTVANGSLLDFETATSHEITVRASDDQGAVSAEVDFTINVLDVSSTISGTVFVDADGDGLFDGGNETAIDGVTIELLDASGNLLATNVTAMGGVYAFVVDDEFATYRVREIQPTGVDEGAAILGDLNGNNMTGEAADGTVLSSNEMLFTLIGLDAIDYDFTESGQAIQSGDTASIGFWQNKHGQALIEQGGPGLVAWLNENFSRIFGSTFSDGMGGDDAAEVADFYKAEFFKKKITGTPKVDAQFMAVALSTYFTSSNLSGGNAAASYGFHVTDTGIGTRVVNVGESGAAFNVADNSDVTIMALLLATNNLTGADADGDASEDHSYVYDTNGDGVLDAAERALRVLANELYTAINEGGDI